MVYSVTLSKFLENGVHRIVGKLIHDVPEIIIFQSVNAMTYGHFRFLPDCVQTYSVVLEMFVTQYFTFLHNGKIFEHRLCESKYKLYLKVYIIIKYWLNHWATVRPEKTP